MVTTDEKFVKGKDLSDFWNNCLSTFGSNDLAKYNLGKYDTYIDNGDGTATITRQTGYANKQDFKQQDGGWFYAPKGYSSDTDNVVANQTFEYSYSYSFSTSHWYFESGNYCFCVSNSDIDTISIQYKLPTSYTEKVITNVRNNVYDNFVKDEYNKTLNLFDNNSYLIRKTFSVESGNTTWQFALYLSNNATSVSSYGARFLYGGEAPLEPALTQTIQTTGDYYVIFGLRGNQRDDFCYTGLKMHIEAGTYTFTANCPTFTATDIVVENIMLNKGSSALPYQEYYGEIVHQKDVEALDNWTSLYQSNNFELEYSRFKNGRYILHVHCNQVNISTIGNLITSIPGQHSFLKPSKTIRAVIAADYQNASGRVSCGLDLDNTGTIYAYPHIHNQMSGSVALTLYGDAYFIIY